METPALSVVLPAYNEAARLPPFLDSVRQYLQTRYPDAWEVIVVDDGSRDGTAEFLQSQLSAGGPSGTTHFAPIRTRLSVLTHPVNRGKGAAVRAGMLAARGERLLFADADGATPIGEADRLAEAVDRGADIAIGSRLAAAAGLSRRRTPLRRLAGRGFACLARTWLQIPQRDTQCGFKMFRREAGHALFSQVQESGYLFDLELLVLAHRGGYQVAEVPINWSEIAGSHLHPFRESSRILIGLWRIGRRVRRQTIGD